LPSPHEAETFSYSDADRAMIASTTGSHVVGDPATVVAQLAELTGRTGVDELMVTTSTFTHADRLRSYQLLAEAAGLEAPGANVASAVAAT
jgi:alkanesulfonate monooxygenase SsuD/methylene tetrahydromethanopterin reductase-like flavin-dependent oxidoreductase (luciferase family)